MVFSSPIFLFLFLPVVLAIYFALRGLRARNWWLLVASFLFYAWGEPAFILLLLVSTAVNFFLGKWVENTGESLPRKRVVAVAVVLNVGFLAFFKYTGLAVTSLNQALASVNVSALPVPQIALPIGISFFTFHALSYIIDIYRRKRSAARHPQDVALYIFFFPQLIAGPILRWNAIGPQLEHRIHNTAKFAEGVRRFVGGLAKKMIIANSVAVPADQIFALPADELSASVAWLGLACYTIQIYFDFSGYSDMAVGLGKMFGFQFIENFQFPYTAQSIRDFWHRWHISLSTWFRDYVYIPLGGNRVSVARNHVNLVAVFFLCGLWHGASWTFVIWGLYHGLFLVFERTRWGVALARFPRPMRHLYAIFIVMMGWVLFRADTFPHAVTYFTTLLGGSAALHPQPLFRYTSNEVLWNLGLGVAFSAPLWAGIKDVFITRCQTFPAGRRRFYSAMGRATEIALIVAVLVVSAALLADGTYNPFIYFRF